MVLGKIPIVVGFILGWFNICLDFIVNWEKIDLKYKHPFMIEIWQVHLF